MNQRYDQKKEYEALVAAGIHPDDAQATVDRIAAMMPDDVDPAKWIPTNEDRRRYRAAQKKKGKGKSDVEDARQAWQRDAPGEYKRILDAGDTPGE